MQRLLLPALAAAALLAACGSSGKSSASERAGYVNQVDAICAQTTTDLKETSARLDELARSARNVSEFTDDLGDAQQLARDELDSIKAVKVPKGDEAKIDKVLAARDRQLDAIDRLIAAARRNDATAFKVITGEVTNLQKTARGLADEYGFKICGEG